MSREKSRLAILNTLLAFPTVSQKDWTGDLSESPKPGDLVSLNCAAPSKWYLSWVHDTEERNGWTHTLLESIEDGELSWWHNVGFSIYNRERVANNPQWRWDDKQWAFWSRWRKACRKHDAYIMLPVIPSFGEGNSVTLDVRIRHSLNRYRNPRTFDNWKKTTIAI